MEVNVGSANVGIVGSANVGIVGIGIVGGAIHEVLNKKNIPHFIYDKYKPEYNSNTHQISILRANIVFLCLPTPFENNGYNLDGFYDFFEWASKNEGLSEDKVFIIKSTILPQTSNNLSKYVYEKYNQKINIIHNPEFLSVKTASYDFEHQAQIILGKSNSCCEEKYSMVYQFYKNIFPTTPIVECESTQSETTKLLLNNFYAVKVQFFTEAYILCNKLGINYNGVVDMMIRNGWINKMHTQVPGHDGEISYGGACFPKDTNALLGYMKELSLPCGVIESTVGERNKMRKDN